MASSKKPNSKAMRKEDIALMFAYFAANNPSPQTELVYSSPFELLIAVILSAQATDVGVNKATAKLYAVANTPAAIVALGLDGLKAHINSIGLYNAKAANVMLTCQRLLSAFNGEVPSNRDDLMSLPGVGRKTANVVLNTVFGQPTMAVDTHVFRLGNRTGLAIAPTVDGVEQLLLKRIPKQYLYNAHHWLILHGRYVCKARAPECSTCQVAEWCQYRHKNLA